MSCIDKALRPGERVMHTGGLHWVIFVPALILAGVGLSFVKTAPMAGLAFGALAVLGAIRAGVAYWTTEIAITDRRFVLKRGLISRDTIEINNRQLEAVDLLQPVVGRMLGYGTLLVRGSGQSTAKVEWLADPVGFRNSLPNW